MSQTCVHLLPGEIEMRLRERQTRQPQRLLLGGIRPEEEDLVRIVLGLQPGSGGKQIVRKQSEPAIRFVASPRYFPDRISAK